MTSCFGGSQSLVEGPRRHVSIVQEVIDNQAELRENPLMVRYRELVGKLSYASEDSLRELRFNLDQTFGLRGEHPTSLPVIENLFANLDEDLTRTCSRVLQGVQRGTPWDLQAIEVSKLVRGVIRQDPSLGPLLCGVQVWYSAWVDRMLTYWRDKTKELHFNAQSTQERLEREGREYREALEREYSGRLQALEREVAEVTGKFERVCREKEAVSDVLRHRDREIEALMQQPEYEGKSPQP